jgi:alpha/beta superfamily hydrolase
MSDGRWFVAAFPGECQTPDGSPHTFCQLHSPAKGSAPRVAVPSDARGGAGLDLPRGARIRGNVRFALPPEKTIRFRNGDVELDGRIHLAGDLPNGWPRGCVVCHPHPVYGGDMNNGVVVAITAALAAKGISTLRFDFRGVGASGGTHGGGGPEIGDARAAVAALRAATGIDRIAIAGYSFGSVVALHVAADELQNADDADGGVDAVAAIAPPLAMFDASFVSGIEGALLLVAGDRDQYCPREQLEALEGMPIDPGVVCTMNSTDHAIVKGADHFFGGYEERLGEIVAEWVKGRATFP